MKEIVAKVLRRLSRLWVKAPAGAKRSGGGARPTGSLLPRRLRRLRLGDAIVMTSRLSARVLRLDGRIEDLGVIATRVVTNAFVAFLVDQLQTETTEIGDFKYHDSGTGVVAENVTDTALGTPCGEARSVGTQIEGATANVYKSVATHTYAGPFAITEHGLLSQAAAGTLMDRSVFAAINVVSGDKIEFTYELTVTAGG